MCRKLIYLIPFVLVLGMEVWPMVPKVCSVSIITALQTIPGGNL